MTKMQEQIQTLGSDRKAAEEELNALRVRITGRTRLPSTTQKCGTSSFLRVARVRAARENDLAATIKIELTTISMFPTL